MREEDRRNNPTSYEDYPNPAAKPVVLRPSGDGGKVGSLSTGGPASSEQGLVDDVAKAAKDHALAAASEHRLLFATAELKEPLHISGTARLKIRVASSKPACNLSIMLVSLPWERSRRITDNVITRGWADPQNHKSLRESEPLKPGAYYDLEFDLQPDDQVIRAGQKIGLMIFSSDRDFTLWPEPGTELTVDLDSVSIELPVVGGAEALRQAWGQ